jgi:hypothetical protein
MKGLNAFSAFLILAVFPPISVRLQPDSQRSQSQTQQASEAPKPEQLPIDLIKKTVLFFHTEFLQNGQPKSWDGTGFFIIEPDSRLKGRGVVWLVTNKHMIRSPVGPYFNGVGIRVNAKAPTPSGNQFAEDTLPVMDAAGNLYWCTDPDDETVDLALIQLSPDEDKLDAIWFPTELFVTQDIFKKLKINENDEVLFSGLFNAYRGAKRNFPIVRHGKLALVTDERIPIDPRNPNLNVDLILVEVTSFGGNSGSPVFLRVGGVREGAVTSIGSYSYYLLGVMQGFFSEGADITLDVTAIRGTVSQNSGIAGVIPAEKILHILSLPRALAIHERVVASTLRDEGRFAEAEESYRKSLDLSEKTVGTDHPDVAATLESYGALLYKLGRASEAKQSEARARTIREKANQPPPSPAVH